jgi:phosphatidylglycerol:prolipoprotein diacylglycerol transferase
LAGAERFLVEFVRAKDDRLLGPFTLAQLTSVLMMVAGMWVVAWLREPAAAPAVPPGLTGTTAADDLARRH